LSPLFFFLTLTTFFIGKKNPQNELEGACVLVFANKQDSRNALPVAEVANKLGLHSLSKRCW